MIINLFYFYLAFLRNLKIKKEYNPVFIESAGKLNFIKSPLIFLILRKAIDQLQQFP